MKKMKFPKEAREAFRESAKGEKKHTVCGEWLEIFYDKKIDKLDFSLIEITDIDGGINYKIAIENVTNNMKPKKLVELHIKEAIEIKSIIDKLVYESLTWDETPVPDIIKNLPKELIP